MPLTLKQQNAIELYTQIMEEVKVRLQCIQTALDGRIGLPEPITQEFCFLQLRLICELIALGCLTAHGDITATGGNKLLKESAADSIIKQLELLHPDFYPHPVTMNVTPPSPHDPGSVHIERKDSGFLTKSDLIELKGRCGDYLHRGNIKKLIKSGTPIHVDLSNVVRWTNKIVTLLDQHHIISFDMRHHFLCALQNADNENRVVVAYAVSPFSPPSSDPLDT